jgi:diadenosine tetraphosphatase ApaH/serine/threonine PP2A family protein phosphatase
MVGPEFASCWLKMSRAEEHFCTIKSDLIAWKKSEPYTVKRRSDTTGGRHSLVVEIKGSPPIDRWSVVSGDCIHNLRAALDNLVYAVAIQESGVNPPRCSKDLQFPIAADAAAFASQKWRIRSLSGRAQARIEQAQPYNRPHSELPPLLRLLADFDNVDKHRLLNVVIANVSGGKFSFTLADEPPIFVPPQVEFLDGPVGNGAEFAWFTINPPKQNTKYNYEANFVVSIIHPAGPSGRTLSELGYVLEILIAEVKRIVEQMIL